MSFQSAILSLFQDSICERVAAAEGRGDLGLIKRPNKGPRGSKGSRCLQTMLVSAAKAANLAAAFLTLLIGPISARAGGSNADSERSGTSTLHGCA